MKVVSFKKLMEVAEEKRQVNIDNFLSRVMSCQTVEGAKELEKYYKERVKSVVITADEDIQIRDAIKGKIDSFKTEDDVENF